MESNLSNQAIILEDGKPVLKDIEDTPLAEGEIRIRVEASPMNPSDQLWLAGLYGIKELIPKKTLGAGFEGSGVVTEAHESVGADIVGKTVAFFEDCHNQGFQGLWRKYINKKASDVIQFPEHVKPDEAFAVFVNPLTAVYMINIAKKNGHKALIHGAASSALGKILVRYAKHVDFPVINIVRRQEQADSLKELGAEHILDSSSDTFDDDLAELSKELGATAYFDPIAGAFCGRVLAKMPAKSTAYVYGALSGEPVSLSPIDIIFYQKSITYLYLATWFMEASKEEQDEAFGEVIKDLSTGGKIFGTKIYKTFSLDKVVEACEEAAKTASLGKVIINPQL